MALSLALRTCRISLKLTRTAPSILCPSNRKLSDGGKSVYKTKEAKKIRFYILNRFIEYLKNYDKILEKNFPTTMKTYKVFMDGIKGFSADTKTYFKIMLILNSPGGSHTKLLRRELELYYQMPKDMLKVAPVLLFSSLPFAFYILLPCVYAFPKQILTSHFWTLEQKSKYGIEYLHDRLVHNKPVFRHLQSQLSFIKHHKRNKKLYDKWEKVLGLLGSGAQPLVEDILACKELFMDEPYHLYYISRNHAIHLLKVHRIHSGWFRRTRLADKAWILMEMDKAILREGGVHNMPVDALRDACYFRGLNPTNVDTDHLVKWMTDWIKVSCQVDKDSLSFLLHCPILLAYNEPSNWSLIHPAKKC